MDTLNQYFDIQTTLLRLQRREGEVLEALKQAKYDLRSSDGKLLNYRGSARSFLDKLSGKREETAEALRREVRKAEAALQNLQREKASLEQKRTELTQVLQSLPSSEALRAEAEANWARLEANFCAEALLPLLEENYEALLEYRSLLQGSRLEILTIEDQQQISAEPNVRAEQCRPYLSRLTEALAILGTPFDPGSYYASPAAYLVSAAAKHNRMDRVNQAMDQVLAVKKQARMVLERFDGEE